MKAVNNEPASSWSVGWYLFEDGKVTGPLTAEDAFARTHETQSGAPRMVSRKGFAQWYPLKDFAELHLMAGRYAQQAAEAGAVSSLNPRVDASPRPHQQPVVKAQHVGPQLEIASERIDVLSYTQQIEHARKQVVSSAPSAKKPISRKEKKRLRQEEKRAQKLALAEAQLKKRNADAINKSPLAQEPRPFRGELASKVPTFASQYLLVASRLRLGRVRNAFAAGFILAPLTLFGYWAAWMGRADEEVNWHAFGSASRRIGLPLWLALIPGVHFVFAWKLATMVSQMERQNGYKTVSPWAATCLALIPSFYMHHIQGAMNRHWRLHVMHSLRT